MTHLVSGVRFLHRQHSLTPEAFDSFQVTSLFRAVDLTKRTLPLRRLPILLHLLTQLCQLSDRLSTLGYAMKVCPIFGFLAMLMQSNLAPSSA